MILTALPSMSVVMNCEAAWAVKPFAAVVADMFPRLMVVTVLRVHRTSRPRWRRSVPGVRVPSKTRGRNRFRRRAVLLRVNAGVHSVENELWGDGTGAHYCLVFTPWSDEICKKRLISPRNLECAECAGPYRRGLLGKRSRRLGSGVGDMVEGGWLVSCHRRFRSYSGTASPSEGGPQRRDVYRRPETRR